MARKLPLCALCGSVLTTKGHLTLEWCDIPGKPNLGWCATQDAHHWEEDDAFLRLRKDKDDAKDNLDTAIGIFKEIDSRGPGRLIVTRRWKKAIRAGGEE